MARYSLRRPCPKIPKGCPYRAAVATAWLALMSLVLLFFAVEKLSSQPLPYAIPAFNLSAADAAEVLDDSNYETFRWVAQWLETVTSRCRRLLRPSGDEPICFDRPLTIGTDQSCLVMSFGSGGDWRFEETMAQLGCEVLAFSLKYNDSEKLAQAGIVFERAGLWGKNGFFGGEKLLTLDAIAFHSGRDGWPINYLKVDTDGGEYEFLQQQVTSASAGNLVLDTVEQLLLKVHLPSDLTQLWALRALELYRRTFVTLHQLGFRVVDTQPDLEAAATLYRYPGVQQPLYLVRRVLAIRSGPDTWNRADRQQPDRIDIKYG